MKYIPSIGRQDTRAMSGKGRGNTSRTQHHLRYIAPEYLTCENTIKPTDIKVTETTGRRDGEWQCTNIYIRPLPVNAPKRFKTLQC
jgi:hypothetical protein